MTEVILQLIMGLPLNIQPIVVVGGGGGGLKRQQVAALTNFNSFCWMLFFLFCLTSFFSPSALNDLAGPSAGPLA